MKKLYTILLDNNKIGTTELEKADPPMGVVFGKINFIDIPSGYNFFKNYCVANNIEIIADYPEDKVIGTAFIPNIKVFDPNGIEIKGLGTDVGGMDTDIFEITISGVPYPFYEKEFPHHVKVYNDMFGSN